MIPIADARAEVIAAVPRLPGRRLPIADVVGRTCLADVVSDRAVPPFANCSLDGYAVRNHDISGASQAAAVSLAVLGTVPAGTVAPSPVEPGTAWKVMTGAPLPEGADTVVMVELTNAGRDRALGSPGDLVEIHAVPAAGTGIRLAGSDVTPGDVIVPAGTVLHPPWLAVLAGNGVQVVEVSARPRVGVLVTGDELVREARALAPGEIYDANSAMVLALLDEAGCDPIDMGVAADDPAVVAKLILGAAREFDAIVTTGGVSMGDLDPVKDALDQLGVLRWMQVGMRPAKPFAYALLDGPDRPVPLFGLPGNPVSSLVSFEILVRPALRSMTGHSRLFRPEVTAVADEPMAAMGTDGRTTLLRVRGGFEADGRLHVRPVGGAQESHQIASSARADALAVLPAGVQVAPGEEVIALLLRGD